MRPSTPAKLSAQLKFWTLRGVACAGPSFYLAWTSGYSHPREVAGMVAAIVTVILALAWLTTRPAYIATIGGTRYGRSLRFAASLRAVWGVFGVAMIASERLFPRMLGGNSAIFIVPDFYTGVIAFVVTGELGKIFHQITSEAANSFFWTYLTTLLQGGLVAAGLMVFAGLLSGLARLIPNRPSRNDVAEVS